MLAIEIKNLSLSFGKNLVLDNINFVANEGDFIGLIGPNGAGKTVLTKVILGLCQPDTGFVKIFGESPQKNSHVLGYVPQFARFSATFPMRVIDVVLMGRLGHTKIGRRFSKEDLQKAITWLEKVELLEFKDKQISDLSGGQIQRVLIARALCGQPKILLLDEPTASLDSKVGRSIYQLLAEEAKNTTIIMVSHDLGVISKHVKTIACLNKQLHYHSTKEIPSSTIEHVYGCPVELIAHGHAHRVLSEHDHEKEEEKK